MKKMMKRLCTLAFCILLAVCVPAETWAETMSAAETDSETDTQTDAEEEESAGETQEDVVVETQEDTTTCTVTTETTDETGNGSDEEDTDTEEEVTVVSETKSYSLSITTSTTAASSSNSALKTLSVSAPVMTTTTVTTYSDGTSETSVDTHKYSLTVKVHVRNVGFKTATLNSAKTTYSVTASDAASGNYIQAVQITPSANLKNAMSEAGLTFYYKSTTMYFGTLGWAAAGKWSGSIGNACPMTGFTLKVIKASSASSVNTKYRYISQTSVQYKTKKTGGTWYSSVTNGATSGTSSSSIGGLAAKIVNTDSNNAFSGGITYCVRTTVSDSDSNWGSWQTNNVGAGSTNGKIRAIKVKLTGDLANYFDVYYRVYVTGYGWLGWGKNGNKAGLTDSSLTVSAVQIKLVPKGASAPGTSTYRFVSGSGSNARIKMLTKAQSLSSGTKYLILVDRANCKVGIFSGSKNNWTLKYFWSCCVGKASTPTISGSYTATGYKAYSFGESKGYSCYYATQIKGNYLFHSVLYYPYSNTIKDGTMGKAVSHGCIRLTKTNAKWIYDNINKGTKIYIY